LISRVHQRIIMMAGTSKEWQAKGMSSKSTAQCTADVHYIGRTYCT